MKPTLTVGMTHRMPYVVPDDKTVPYVFDDSAEFAAMPPVLATAFLVGLIERACVEALLEYLDWPDEQTVGTRVEVSHTAATPPGMTVEITVELVEIDRRRLVFDITAHDEVDQISSGRHERFVIDATAFRQRATDKSSLRGADET